MTNLSSETIKPGSAGFSLVELLVSMFIGLLILGGVVQVVVGSKKSFMDQEEMAFIQENVRYALDVLARDIRASGYTGCADASSASVASSLKNMTNPFTSMVGIRGYEGSPNTDSFPSEFKGDSKAESDAILLSYADVDNALAVDKHNATAAAFHVFGQHNFKPGSTMIVVEGNCRNIGIFEVTGPTSVPANHMNHAASTTSANCTKAIKGNFTCASTPCGQTSCGGTSPSAYGAGSSVMQLVSRAYFVGDSKVLPDVPALFREGLQNGSGTQMEELVQGVEDMELLYGFDTGATPKTFEFRRADQIATADWAQVIAVRINLVMRSQSEVFADNQAVTVFDIPYNDRYMRRGVTSTVALRN